MINHRSILIALVATLSLALPPASAASWRPAQVLSVEQQVAVARPKTIVTIRAHLASPDYEYLDELTLSYQSISIEVPQEILEAAQLPILEQLKLSYCCEGIIAGAEPKPREHPHITAHLPFWDEGLWEANMHSAQAVNEIEWPYLSIEFGDGKILAYSIWSHKVRGRPIAPSDWEVKRFLLKNGGFIEDRAT